MDADKDRKRKKDKHREDDSRKEKKSKRAHSRSPSPDKGPDRDSRRKRRHSKSQSPPVKLEREDRNRAEPGQPEIKKDAPQRKAKDTDMLNTRTGGAYIPPARLRMMQAQITDKSSMAYQRLAWEALKKSIHGHINKINVGNIGIIIKELLKENIVRGRGLLCRSVIQAQAASPTFTNVYAALVSAVNSRFPNIGELLLKRLVIQFKRGFKRNDKPTCISSASFIAHLVNQRVAHEIIALELLTLLVETPTDDSVEVSIAFLKECGQKLSEVSSKGVNTIFEMLRNILHEGQLDKRVQYMIEVMFQVWKDGFKDHPALIEELELVPEEEQFTHLLMLDDATDPQDILNVFKHDEKYEENEEKYKTLSKEILGSDAESGDEDGSGESGSEGSDEDEEGGEQKAVTIIDNTETNLIALRRTIYLTINSSLDFEECAHKLMKMQLKPGQEVELCHMFLDCCAEQRTYEKFYGLLAQRFCNINRLYIGPFEEIFKDSYSTAHRLDTNRLRNVSKFFAHLLFTDSIGWEVMECVKLNEEDTTSSSRIYIKILFQELAEYMGLKKLNDRLKDPTLQEAFGGVFPRDNPKNTRFSINFFTSIGLGGLTDELRDHLKQMPKNVPPPITEIHVSSSESSSSSSDSSSSSSSSSSSDSEEEGKKKEKSKKSKKDKSKDKSQNNQEEAEKEKPVERWGHDGFYDTYGKDARRETRPDRPDARTDRPNDGFARPRDPPRRTDRRNGDDRRREDPRNNKDESRNNKDASRNNKDDSRNRDDSRNNRDDPRNNRDDSRNRDADVNNREDSRNVRDDSRNNRDDSRNNRDDSRNRDAYRNNREDSRNVRDDSRNVRDDSRNNRDDPRNVRDDSRNNRDDPRNVRDDSINNRDDSRSDRDALEDSRRKGDKRNDERRRDDARTARDEDSRRQEGDRRSGDDRRRDDSRNDREEDSRRHEGDRRRNNRDEGIRPNQDRRDGDRDDVRERNRESDDRRRRDDKGENVDADRDRRREETSRRSEKEVNRNKEDKPGRERRNRDREDDSRHRKEYESASDTEEERNEKRERTRNSNEEKRSKKKNKKHEENIEGERKKKDRRKESSSSSNSSSSSSSESEDEKSSKHKMQREDGWDIRRASSIRREIPTSYWDSYKVDSREGKRSKDRGEVIVMRR